MYAQITGCGMSTLWLEWSSSSKYKEAAERVMTVTITIYNFMFEERTVAESK